jgi:hypothetical protein
MLSRILRRQFLKPVTKTIMASQNGEVLSTTTLSLNKINKVNKIDKLKMQKVITPELEKLVDIFNRHNYEIRIAGGAVRDLISEMQGGVPDDIDLATIATPQEMKEMFANEGIRTINDQGEKHGTVTAR